MADPCCHDFTLSQERQGSTVGSSAADPDAPPGSGRPRRSSGSLRDPTAAHTGSINLRPGAGAARLRSTGGRSSSGGGSGRSSGGGTGIESNRSSAGGSNRAMGSKASAFGAAAKSLLASTGDRLSQISNQVKVKAGEAWATRLRRSARGGCGAAPEVGEEAPTDGPGGRAKGGSPFAAMAFGQGSGASTVKPDTDTDGRSGAFPGSILEEEGDQGTLGGVLRPRGSAPLAVGRSSHGLQARPSQELGASLRGSGRRSLLTPIPGHGPWGGEGGGGAGDEGELLQVQSLKPSQRNHKGLTMVSD